MKSVLAFALLLLALPALAIDAGGPTNHGESISVELIDARGSVVERCEVAGKVTIKSEGYEYQQNGRPRFRHSGGLRVIVTRLEK